MHSVLLAWKILFKGKSFISREIKVYSLTYSKTQSSVAEEALAFYIYRTVKVSSVLNVILCYDYAIFYYKNIRENITYAPL